MPSIDLTLGAVLRWVSLPRHCWSAMVREAGLVEGITDLLSREWINRIWCLQETLLARNLVLCCGQKSMPWPEFSYGLTYLGDCKSPGGVTFDKLTPWSQLVSMRAQFHAPEVPVSAGNTSMPLLSSPRRELNESPLDDYHKAPWRLQIAMKCILVLVYCLILICVLAILGATRIGYNSSGIDSGLRGSHCHLLCVASMGEGS